MKPIAIFFHTVFFKADGGAFQRSGPMNAKYMKDLEDSGLMEEASHFTAGINGGKESEVYAKCYLPRAQHLFHGIDVISANFTFQAMHDFCVAHPGWNVLFFHGKSIAHETPEYVSYLPFEMRWINCMVNACIRNWRTCVADLETHDSVGCHWMENVGNPPVDHIWGGTFYWVTSDFAATLPSLYDCPLVKQFGMKSIEGRATGEQWIGLGPKLPRIKDYHVNGIGSCP